MKQRTVGAMQRQVSGNGFEQHDEEGKRRITKTLKS